MGREADPETWQEWIDIDYQYDCPTDNYLDGPDQESITENYNGPARLIVLVDRESKIVEVTLREWEAYDGRPDRANCDTVELDCSVEGNALVCEVLSDYHNNHLDDVNVGILGNEDPREEKSIKTPDGYEEFTWHYPIHPDELYQSEQTSYENGEWKLVRNTNLNQLGGGVPLDWKEVREMRNNMLAATDGSVSAADAPDSVKEPIIAMRQKLRDLPADLADIDDLFVPSSFPSTKPLEQG
jgi:hypothetical protein